MNTQELSKQMFDLLLEKEKLEDLLKETNKSLNQLSTELYEAMETENIDDITIRGIKFSKEIKRDFTIDSHDWDSDLFFNWLKQIGEDGIIRTKQTVPWNTRNKFLKEYIDDGNPLPEFIHELFFNTIKYNKSAIKRLYEESK